jgi:hypothetical protein
MDPTLSKKERNIFDNMTLKNHQGIRVPSELVFLYEDHICPFVTDAETLEDGSFGNKANIYFKMLKSEMIGEATGMTLKMP